MKQDSVFAGVELGGTKCVCVLANVAGEILAQERVPTEHPDRTLPAIEDILRGWFDSKRSFEALGLAAFGPLDVDPQSANWGKIGPTTKPDWADVQLAQRLRDNFDVPCALDTDVNGAALSEMRWGAAEGLSDFAYVTVGTGVGVGLVSQGRPVRGFGHGEAGHMRIGRVEGDTWPGNCSFHGDCVEGLAAGPAIAERMGMKPRLIGKDDPVWNYVGHAIAQMLHNLVLTATPRRIFVGGGVATAQPQLLPIVRRELQLSLNGYMHCDELENMDEYVVAPGLGDLAGPLGPIALAISAARTERRGNLRLAI